MFSQKYPDRLEGDTPQPPSAEDRLSPAHASEIVAAEHPDGERPDLKE